MASFYKRKRDQHKKRPCWFIGYTDQAGKRRTVKGFPDRSATEQMAAKLEHEAMLRRRGLIDPAEEQIADRKRQPIETHLTAFERKLGQATSKHQKLTMSRIRRIIDGCGFETAGEIEAEAVREYLVEFCQENDLGNKTFNHYLQAFGSFCTWLVDTKRLLTDPISMLQPLNTEVDIRHKRRALTVLEIQRLVESARQSDEDVQCFDGEQRARIYTISYFTGLRRKEIASLSPQSFDLDPTKPTVTIEAACSKHRQRDVLQLHPVLVALLPAWLEGVPADHELFPKLAKRRTWLMVKKDLERAGIPYETSEGIADFHAAGRHSYITGLDQAGVPVSVIQKLARHSDIRMTMRYVHVDAKAQAKAVAQLPWQRSGSVSNVPSGHSGSPGDAGPKPKRRSKKRQNPGGDQGYDATCHDPSPAVASDEKWRRRATDSQIRVIRKALQINKLRKRSFSDFSESQRKQPPKSTDQRQKLLRDTGSMLIASNPCFDTSKTMGCTPVFWPLVKLR